jgi:thiol-disulfide isomerase/thioredoxin
VPRRPLLLLATLATALTLSGCGVTTYRNVTQGSGSEDVTLGWHKITPVAIDLPTGDPIGSPSSPDLTGPLIVNIWASWCEVCKDELPLLQKLDSEHTMTVVGFSRDIHQDKAENTLARYGVTYANWMDPEARIALAMDGKVPINAVPSSLLIVGGKVVAVHIGQFKKPQDVLDGE